MDGDVILPESEKLRRELLVVRCQRGERAAFEQLVREWERPLVYYLRRMVASEADAWDLLQETWIKVFRSLGTLRDRSSLAAFLYTVARNGAVSHLRGDVVWEDSSQISAAEANGDDVAAFDDAEQVHRLLDQLPLAQREALTLYFLQDLPIEQIAAVTGAAVGTVKSRLYYGKQALRKRISDGDCHGGK